MEVQTDSGAAAHLPLLGYKLHLQCGVMILLSPHGSGMLTLSAAMTRTIGLDIFMSGTPRIG